MSKNGVRGLIVLALILAVFCTIAFVAPFCMTATFWAAFICGVVAIAFQFYVFSVSFSKGQGAKSKFYGFPIARIGVTYLLVQLVLSFVEMGLSCKIPAWVAIIINVIVFVIAAIGCIAAEVVRDEVVRQDDKVKQDIVNMKSLSAMAAGLPGLCQDEALKKDLQKLADEQQLIEKYKALLSGAVCGLLAALLYRRVNPILSKGFRNGGFINEKAV